VIPKDEVLHGRIWRPPLIDGHRYIDCRFGYFDWNGSRAKIGNRRNGISFHDDRLFKGLPFEARVSACTCRRDTGFFSTAARVFD
jgi:hypothetical protein